MTRGQPTTVPTPREGDGELQRLADLERRSLLAEQARQLAHSIRTPLSVIDLVCETLQLEPQNDRDTLARLGQVLSASGKVSAALSDTLRRNRFSNGTQRPIDVLALAARLTLMLGGRVGEGDAVGSPECRVVVEPDAYDAAVLHILRLIGEGRAIPVLTVERKDGFVILRFSTGLGDPDDMDCGAPAGFDRADRHLMLLAVERFARECSGRLQRGDRWMSLELPVIQDQQKG